MAPSRSAARSQSQSLDQALDRAGFYPRLVSDVVADALEGQECLSHLVQVETHFEQNEVHRHITVLALTGDFLVVAHVDDQQLDEQGSQMVAQVSTESVPVSQIRSVILSYVYAQPQDYQGNDPIRELSLSIGWAGSQRLDLAPASCGDPQCEADHGYTGTMAQEDLVMRVSVEADGPQAVYDAKVFARTLRSASVVPASPAPVEAAGWVQGPARRGRTHYR
ncbi:DUF5998 family protein [Psychromicrobium xiongbiense]|uniref:DUF5998 family protein n=1 Tax=Psychromicrobium xiongbiense TaxID=3051184 RepID=UPI002555BB5C|nr:DUF5998 family protein [Psychromicrobium sp. YIM S02556]